MRKGEILALKWRDLDAGRLNVSRTLEQTKASVRLKESKSERGRRTIVLPESAVVMLRRHRAEQNRERLAIGAGYEANDLVFPKVDGSMWPPTSFDWHYAQAVARAGVGAVRFHDIRHTHATALLRNGVNVKVVSERLGHASVRITLETYAHVLPDMQEDAAVRLDALVRQATER